MKRAWLHGVAGPLVGPVLCKTTLSDKCACSYTRTCAGRSIIRTTKPPPSLCVCASARACVCAVARELPPPPVELFIFILFSLLIDSRHRWVCSRYLAHYTYNVQNAGVHDVYTYINTRIHCLFAAGRKMAHARTRHHVMFRRGYGSNAYRGSDVTILSR